MSIRKTLRRYEIPGHARFLTFSTYRREPTLDEHGRTVFADQLAWTRTRLGFRLFAWVVMPEHVHLLVMPDLPEGADVARILSAIKRPVATSVRRLGRERGLATGDRFWQAGGGYDRNIFSEDELVEKIGYIHDNPVRRGLVEVSTDWPWSSARAWKRMDTLWPDIDHRSSPPPPSREVSD
ncbi:MAG: transposase [Planctomycetota bacterium]